MSNPQHRPLQRILGELRAVRSTVAPDEAILIDLLLSIESIVDKMEVGTTEVANAFQGFVDALEVELNDKDGRKTRRSSRRSQKE